MAARLGRRNDPARARSFPGTNVEDGMRIVEDIRKSIQMHQARMADGDELRGGEMMPRFSGHVEKLSEIRDSLQPFANPGTAAATAGGFGLNEDSLQTLMEMGFDQVRRTPARPFGGTFVFLPPRLS